MCGSTPPVPGVVDTLPHRYEVYRLVNTDTASACFTITLTWTPGAATMWANTYSSFSGGQSVTTNWIGDVDGNTNGDISPQSMGITVAAGATIDVVVMSIGQWTSTTPESDPYTLTVSNNSASTIGCIAVDDSLVSLINPTDAGQAAQFTDTLTGPASLAIPTGNVKFLDDGGLLGSSSLDAGVATFSLVLAPGDHPISAVYPGDSVYANVTSAVVTQTVNAAPDAGPDAGGADGGADDGGAIDGATDDGAAADSAAADSASDDGGVADSAAADSAVVADDGSASEPDAGSLGSGTPDASGDNGAGGDDASVSTGGGSSDSGCSCRLGPTSAQGPAMMALGLGALILVNRRRRKK